MGADPDAREYVIKSLRSRGASLFVPVVGADDVDLAVRGADGQYVEVRVMSPEPDAPGWFRVRRFRPKAYVFFVCVGSPSGASPEAWVFPSGIFERFAVGAPSAESRALDLDTTEDEPLRERLSVYRERWVLIADYARYRSTLSDPVALRMMIAMSG